MNKQTYFTSLAAKSATLGKKLLSIELYSVNSPDFELVNALNPSYFSLTWHHGDLSKPDTLPTILLGKKLLENNKNVVMHIAGRNFTREDAVRIINTVKNMGVKNILALRGGSDIVHTDDSLCTYPYGLQWLQFLKNQYGNDFNIATSGYPIGHPTAEDPIKDLAYLKQKVDAGADFIMCQAVFDLKTFKDFYKRCRDLKIDVPIVPGVYAINSNDLVKQLNANFCKVMPEDYLKNMEKYANDETAITEYSVNYISQLIKSLLTDTDISIPGVHVLCFSNLSLVDKIFKKLNFKDLNIWQP